MLILTRKPGQSLYIGDDVKITIVEIKGNQIRLGIDAPTQYRIYREEIYLQIQEENQRAAETVEMPDWQGLPQQFYGQSAGKVSKKPGPRSSSIGALKTTEYRGVTSAGVEVVVRRKKSQKTDE